MLAEQEKKVKGKKLTFAGLVVGDQATMVALVVGVMADEKHDPPEWVRISLYDGTREIRVFDRMPLALEVDDLAEVDFEVRQGKPFNGNPQLAFKVNSIHKVDVRDPHYAAQISAVQRRPILHKMELQQLADGARVALLTRVLTLHPRDGVREKTQKVLVTDLNEQPISLWMAKTDFPVMEQIKEQEYFLLNAIVKTVPQNPAARFLSFESLLRGTTALKIPLMRVLIKEYIGQNLKKARKFVDMWQDRRLIVDESIPDADVEYMSVLQAMLKEYG